MNEHYTAASFSSHDKPERGAKWALDDIDLFDHIKAHIHAALGRVPKQDYEDIGW
jgi:hypothetical protein